MVVNSNVYTCRVYGLGFTLVQVFNNNPYPFLEVAAYSRADVSVRQIMCPLFHTLRVKPHLVDVVPGV